MKSALFFKILSLVGKKILDYQNSDYEQFWFIGHIFKTSYVLIEHGIWKTNNGYARRINRN